MIINDMKIINERINSKFSIFLAKTHDCTVCKVTKVQLEPFLKKYDIELTEIFIDDIPEFRGDHLVFTVPTVLIFSEGKELLRESRFINMGKVDRLLKLFFE